VKIKADLSAKAQEQVKDLGAGLNPPPPPAPASIRRHRASANLALYSMKEYSIQVITAVVISKAAEKDLRKVPKHVQVNFFTWLDAVAVEGLESVR
jgi:hypothetical protein